MAEDTEAGPDWLGAPAAAKYLGVSLRTLYRFIDQDGLPAYQMGRVIRLRRSQVDEWIETQRVPPGSLAHLYPTAAGPEDADTR